MYETPCARDELDGAYQDLCEALNRRRSQLWAAYSEATADMSRREYEEFEAECWSVLQAGLAGIAAEERAIRREYERRLNAFGYRADSTGQRAS